MTARPTQGPPEPCEVCERTVPVGRRHPCRFERACACWYGTPCQPAGASYKTTTGRRP